jgi:multidrug efflux system outer membrane protein
LPADQADSTDRASFGDQKWWEAFQDETLQLLIRTALKRNYDVRIAAARILQAGAQLGITRADQFPTVTAGAAALNERIPRTLAQPAVNTSASQVSLSVAWGSISGESFDGRPSRRAPICWQMSGGARL